MSTAQYLEFVDSVRTAKLHSGGMKLLPLFRLERDWFEQILSDVNHILTTRPGSSVESPQHPTHWVRPFGSARQFSLYNTSGKTDELGFGQQNLASNKRFWIEECLGLGRLIDCFEGDLISFRINELLPDSGLNAHEEAIESRKGLVLRFHIPVFTNDQAFIVLDEERYHFEPGVLYYFNKGCVHSAWNQGKASRLHFVFDMYLTESLFDRLLSRDVQSFGAGFEPLSPEERCRLSAGIPWPVKEYVEGRDSGEVLLFQKAGQQYRKVKKLTPDICDDAAVSFGPGWWGFERYEGESFRWHSAESSLEIEAAMDGTCEAALELAPGPSLELTPAGVSLEGDAGVILSTIEVKERMKWTVKLAVHAGINRFRIQVEGPTRHVAGDARLLCLRVFALELGPVS